MGGGTGGGGPAPVVNSAAGRNFFENSRANPGMGCVAATMTVHVRLGGFRVGCSRTPTPRLPIAGRTARTTAVTTSGTALRSARACSGRSAPWGMVTL
ncbi:MAG: hypothetical protein K2I81_03745 [Alphaproteobacteria bacterium]|nr:hypothetical protein [Alphaproteobacteria bacterium]